MNEKVRGEIGKLFVEDKKIVIYLTNGIANIKLNDDWGVAFGIKNLAKGEVEAGRFHYEVTVASSDVTKRCGVSEAEVEKWIVLGRSGDITINPGEFKADRIRFSIPENAPLCMVRFNLAVTKDNTHYYTESFDIEVVS